MDRLFELIKFVNDQNAMRITTGKLNEVLADATTRVQPPTDKGRRLKICIFGASHADTIGVKRRTKANDLAKRHANIIAQRYRGV